MPELSLALDKLGWIIAKAREYGAEVAPADGGAGSDDDGTSDILDATVDNPTREELVAAIEGLNEDERVDLLALAWMGRGDFSKAEWSEALAQARRSHDKREPEYLASTPLFADYLEEALTELGFAAEDIAAEES